MQVEASRGPIEELDVQALAVAVFKNEKADSGFLKKVDELSGGLVRSALDAEEFSGKEGETAYFHLLGNDKLKARRLLLVGAGEAGDYKSATVSQMAGTAVRSLRSKNVKSIAVLPRFSGDARSTAATAVEGAYIALFDPDKYRTVDKEEKTIDRLVVVVEDADVDALQQGVTAGKIVGESVNFTRDLANEPGAYMTPTDMADRAREIASEFGLSIDILDEARMEQEGMGSLLSVARGSDQPAKLIILKYTPTTPPADSKELLAFVGKGVTFDSGGISLKPGENMELMKYDMTGGATVMGAMRAIAQLKPPIPILGVAPCTENLPSGKATKPGDVVKAMTGKTIEIINTDAEGRLVLADVLTYAKRFNPAVVVDAATLTGAVVIALGHTAVGVMGNDDKVVQEVLDAAKRASEPGWPLPLWDDYKEIIKSDVADIKNAGGRAAGTITAALFLKEFAEGYPWVHLDIAGTAYTQADLGTVPRGPTGVPVGIFVEFVRGRAS